MADTAQDRTEPATPRRREEARKRGQVARSADLTAAIVLLGAVLVLYFSCETLMSDMVALIRHCLSDADTDATPAETAVGLLYLAGAILARAALPLLAVTTLLALLAGFGQVGPLLSWTPVTPSLDKLNPISGLQRMFNLNSVVHLVMGIAKIALLSLVAYSTLRSRLTGVLQASTLSHLALIEVSLDLLFSLMIRLALVLLVLAIIDYLYQRWKMERDLRMTRQEVREELKRMDGDPNLKRRRREVQLQMALHRIRKMVPHADVVVTNPTEFAVAIQYDSRSMAAPKVTAKGADYLAARIRELAVAHGVPIVEQPPLARELYRTVEVGREIPLHLYKTVAEVLAYVYELAGRQGRRHAVAG